MKKLLYLVLIFTFFFNGTIVNNTSRQVIQDVDEPIFKIEPARVDQETLRISWLVEGLESLESGDLESLDSVVLSVRELNADGFLNDPQEFIFYTLNGQKDFSWDGTTALSIRLIVKSIEYSQYSGPDCESMFCYREITKQITSEEYLIDALPEVPVVQIPDELEPEVIGVVEGSTPGELAELLDKDVDDILVDLLGLNILKSEDDVLSDNEIKLMAEQELEELKLIQKVIQAEFKKTQDELERVKLLRKSARKRYSEAMEEFKSLTKTFWWKASVPLRFLLSSRKERSILRSLHSRTKA